jgi:hypothetical protein
MMAAAPAEKIHESFDSNSRRISELVSPWVSAIYPANAPLKRVIAITDQKTVARVFFRPCDLSFRNLAGSPSEKHAPHLR